MLYVKSDYTNQYYGIWDDKIIQDIKTGILKGFTIISKKEYDENIKKLGL